MLRFTIFTACLLMGLCFSALAAEKIPLHQSTHSWDGGSFAYPSGQAEVTTVRLRLNPGDEVPFHCHPVPTFGYVVSGKVRVQLLSGKSATFEAGDAVIEVMNTVHRGTAVGGPVEILVFYAGAKGMPTTLMQDDPRCQSNQSGK